jgi:tripartite-type tricarboxylate transporter receptor subunit TctC
MQATLRTSLGLALGLGLVATTAAADYPDKPITIVVPFSAGGGTDTTARTIARFLEPEIGGTVVVVNRPGASGEIGLTEVATAEPDGYTLGIINTPGIVTIPIERETRFNVDSFAFIAGVVEDPATVNVLETSEIDSIADLINEARARPGEITVGTQGIGSAGHISLLLLEKAADVTFRPIPYDGAASARTALLSGEIEATTANLGEALTFAEGTPWRILGVMSPVRSPIAPDLPTFAETGYDVVGGSLRGIGGPSGIPDDILDQLSTALERVVANPEFQQIAADTHQPLRYVPRDEYLEILAKSDKAHRELWIVKPWNQ